jgi:hypothetical protein
VPLRTSYYGTRLQLIIHVGFNAGHKHVLWQLSTQGLACYKNYVLHGAVDSSPVLLLFDWTLFSNTLAFSHYLSRSRTCVQYRSQLSPSMWDFKFSRRRVWSSLLGVDRIFRNDNSSPDEGGSTPLWSVGLLQRGYTALYPRRLSSSGIPMLHQPVLLISHSHNHYSQYTTLYSNFRLYCKYEIFYVPY